MKLKFQIPATEMAAYFVLYSATCTNSKRELVFNFFYSLRIHTKNTFVTDKIFCTFSNKNQRINSKTYFRSLKSTQGCFSFGNLHITKKIILKLITKYFAYIHKLMDLGPFISEEIIPEAFPKNF